MRKYAEHSTLMQPLINAQNSICLVGVDENLQNLVVDLIPAARVLGFPAPTPSERAIDSGALNLLDSIHHDYRMLQEHGVSIVQSFPMKEASTTF